MQAKVAELQHLAELSRETQVSNKEECLHEIFEKNKQLEKQLQSLRLELANTIALNVETDEAYQESVQKYEKQSIEVFAVQELYKNASSEIASLKLENERLQRSLKQSDALITEYRENINVIQAQVCLKLYYHN